MLHKIELTIQDLSWVTGEEDVPDDQCAHGTVIFRVNETTFVEPEDGNWTVSTTVIISCTDFNP